MVTFCKRLRLNTVDNLKTVMKKWLLTVLCCLMAFSCSDDSVSLGKDVVVKAFPEHYDLGEGEPMETDFHGLVDIKVHGKEVYCMTMDPTGLIGAIDLDQPQSWTRFLRMGNGPLETLAPIPFHTMLFQEGPDGDLLADFYDMKKGILRVNLSQSLRQGSLAASRTGDLPSGLSGTAGLTLLDTDTFFFQHPSPDSRQVIRGLWKSGERVTPAQERLNSFSLTEPDSFMFNLFMTMPGYDPTRERIVEASSLQNTIHLYDLHTPFARTVHVYERAKRIEDLEESGPEGLKSSFKKVLAFPSFFAVLYSGDSLYKPVGQNPRVLFFDWEGRPLAEAAPACAGTTFDIDLSGKKLYIADQKSETIRVFDLSKVLDKIMNSSAESPDVTTYSPLRSTEEVADLSPFITDLDMIQVGVDSVARTGMRKILFSDPIVFLCGGAVFSATPDWRFIHRIGNVGRGPGEYLSVKDIVINSAGDEVWCMDLLNDILRYDLKTGAFLEKVQYDDGGYARAMIPQHNNSVLLYTPNPLNDFPENHETFHCIRRYDAAGQETGTGLSWTRFNVMANFSIPVSTTRAGEYVLTPESSDTAYVYDDNGPAYQIRFDFGKKWIPDNFFDPENGDPAEKVGELFDMDCYKLLSSVYLLEEDVYLHAYGKDSSSWNFFFPKDGSRGIRWKSVGVLSPPISALAADGDHLYFLYDDYGYVEEEPDPLKKAVKEKFGSPGTKGATYLIKVKLDVK